MMSRQQEREIKQQTKQKADIVKLRIREEKKQERTQIRQEKLSTKKYPETIISQKTLEVAKDIQPFFLFTYQKQFSIQVEVNTTAEGYRFAENTWEHQTIHSIQTYLPKFQEITNTPVEFHYGISQNMLIMTLSLTGSPIKLGKCIQDYMTTIMKHIPNHHVKILICTGDENIDWQHEHSWTQLNIVRPALTSHFKKKNLTFSQKEHPEHHLQPSEGNTLYVTHNQEKPSELQKYVYLAVFNLSGIDYKLDNGGVYTNKKHRRLVGGMYDNGKESNDALINSEVDYFMTQSLKGTILQKDKKIGAGLQYLVSSAALTYDQLKKAQSLMLKSYHS